MGRWSGNIIGPWQATYSSAKKSRAKYYFTGKMCIHGHTSPRLTSDKSCCECSKEKQRKLYWLNVDESRRRTRESHNTHKVTRSSYNKEYRAENYDREMSRISEYREKNRDELNYRARERARLEPDKNRARSRAYHHDNKEKIAERKKAWFADNPGYAANAVRKRRALKKGSAETHTVQDVERIHSRQGFKCAECKKSTKQKYHVDHIVPLSLGGSNAKTNLQILCPGCNSSKGAKHPIDFAKFKGRLL